MAPRISYPEPPPQRRSPKCETTADTGAGSEPQNRGGAAAPSACLSAGPIRDK